MLDINKVASSILVQACGALRGELQVSGDKSISHRAYMLAALAKGTSVIRGGLITGDGLATLGAMKALGAQVELMSDGIRIEGQGLHGLKKPTEEVNCRRSGTTMRLLAGLVCGYSFSTVLTGDIQLLRRPMSRIAIPLRQMGASVTGPESGRFPPLTLRGGALKPLIYPSPVASAQVKSCLLLAGLVSGKAVQVVEPGLSRDHTERLLTELGAGITVEGFSCSLEGATRELPPFEMSVPGDFSSAAFLIVAGLLVPGSHLLLRNIGVNKRRTGLLAVLGRMGANIQVSAPRVSMGEPVADIEVRHSELKGTTLSGGEVVTLIDEIPILAVAASVADGPTVISDAAELRVKESDRISSVAGCLRALGASVQTKEDGMILAGNARLKGCHLHTHNDHRIVMAMTIAALVARGDSVVEGAQVISDSFPGFLNTLREIGA